jgi:hypothetical protein
MFMQILDTQVLYYIVKIDHLSIYESDRKKRKLENISLRYYAHKYCSFCTSRMFERKKCVYTTHMGHFS